MTTHLHTLDLATVHTGVEEEADAAFIAALCVVVHLAGV